MDDSTIEMMKDVIEIRERLSATDCETLGDGCRLIHDKTHLMRQIFQDIIYELELRNKRFFI